MQGHPDVDRIHVRGFNEEGTTTTPCQMRVLNSMSRVHRAAEAIRRVPALRDRAARLVADREARIEQSVAYTRERLGDPPGIRHRVWSD